MSLQSVVTLRSRKYYSTAGLSEDEKDRFKNIVEKYKKPTVNINEKQIADFIDYSLVPKDDLLFMCKIFIKTISRSPGQFSITSHHQNFIEYMANNPRKSLTKRAFEQYEMKFINAILRAPIKDSEYLPKLNLVIDDIIYPILKLAYGPSIASFIAFPLLERMCRSISSVLNDEGYLICNPKETVFRRNKEPYKKCNRVDNIKHALQFMEQDVKEPFRKILKELNNEIKLYDRIRKERNGLLHGARDKSWESYLVIFLLYAIYISESTII